jgi:uncharacterized protein YndB with AHSA1/START domain
MQTGSDAVPQATPDPSQFGFTRQITIAADPDTVYDLISDVTNISRWSPTADSVYYDEGHEPTAGAWFSGMNHRNGKSWPSRSQVERANRPEVFSFVVGGLHDGIVRWRWTFSPERDGTTVASLTWSLLRLDPVLGASAAEILELQDFMASSVHTTLNALARYLQRVCPHLG